MKDHTPRYIVRDEFKVLAAWRERTTPNGTPGDGRPTVQNLMKWRDGYNLSLCKGGSNDHIGVNGWIQRKIHIYDQYHRRRVVEYNPPAFEVIPEAAEATAQRRKMGLYTAAPPLVFCVNEDQPDPEKMKPMYEAATAEAVKGLNAAAAGERLNTFEAMQVDAEALKALHDPDFKPFRLASVLISDGNGMRTLTPEEAAAEGYALEV